MCFYQMARDACSIFTYEKCPLLEELKINDMIKWQFLYFQFLICDQGALFKFQYTFSMYENLVTKSTFKFVKNLPVIKLSDKM